MNLICTKWLRYVLGLWFFNFLLINCILGNDGFSPKYAIVNDREPIENIKSQNMLTEVILTCNNPTADLFAFVTLPVLEINQTIQIVTPTGQVLSGSSQTFEVNSDITGLYEINIVNILTGITILSLPIDVLSDQELPDLTNLGVLTNVNLTCNHPVINILEGMTLPAALDGIAVIIVVTPNNDTTVVEDGIFLASEPGAYEVIVENTLTGCSANVTVNVSSSMNPPSILGIPDIELTCYHPFANLLSNLNLPPEIEEIAIIKIVNPSGDTITVSNGHYIVVEEGTYEIIVENGLTGCAASINVHVTVSMELPSLPTIPDIALTCANPVANLLADFHLEPTLNEVAIIKVVAPNGDTTTIYDPYFPVSEEGNYEIIVENSTTGCRASITIHVYASLDIPHIPDIADITLTCLYPIANLLADLMLDPDVEEVAIIKVVAPNGDTTTVSDYNFPTFEEGDYKIIVENNTTHCRGSIIVRVYSDMDLPVLPFLPNIELTCAVPMANLLENLTLPNELEGIAIIKVVSPNGDTTVVSEGHFSVATAGEYEIIVENSLTGCAASVTVSVSSDMDLPVLNPIENALLTCANPTLDLLAGWSLPADFENNAIVQVIDIQGVIHTISSLTYMVSEAGIYTIIVTNSMTNCATAMNSTVENDVDLPQISGLPSQFSLNCQGQSEILSAFVNTSIDNLNMTIVRPDGTMNVLQTLDFEVDEVGTYLFKVTNTLSGCMSSWAVNVTEPTALVLSVFSSPETSNGANDGSVGVNILGGTAPYEILWSTGQSETTLSHLTTGVYSVTVTDHNGCSRTATVSVELDNGVDCHLSVQFMVNAISCHGANDGSLNTVLSDGLGPFTYLWSTGATTTMINDLSAGAYSVTVTDANFCTASETIIIADSTPLESPETANTTSAENPACVGDMVQLFTPTVANAIYEWVGPNGYISFDQNPIIEAVSAENVGDYHLYVSVHQCRVISEITTMYINNNPILPLLPDVISVCEGENITISAMNWVDTFPENSVQFDWYFENSIFMTTSEPMLTFENISSERTGNYQVMVRIDGCWSSLSNSTTVQVSAIPDGLIANAGEDREVCGNNNLFLDAANPSLGIGIWTSPTGAGISNPQNPQTEISNMQVGENLFVWMLSNGACTNFSMDTVVITQHSIEDIAFAGEDKDFCLENNSILRLDATVPTVATGRWTQTIAQQNLGVIIVNPTAPDAEIQGLIAGNTYSFTWTLSNGSCLDYTSDQVFLQVSTIPSNTAFIPENEVNYCGQGFLIGTAETPRTGIGHWYALTGATISDPENPRTRITDLSSGENLFIWTLSNSGCQDYSVDTLKVYYEDEFSVHLDTIYVDHNDTLENINLTLNDNLSSLSTWSYFPVSNPQHGDILAFQNGVVTYGPDKYYFGEDYFDYKICSDHCPNVCDTTTVMFKVDKIYFAGDCDIPNVMTPNGDGLNDAFYIPCVDQFPDSELTIFNRWGDKVFETVAYNNTWEGTYKNQPLPEGTYYFFLILEPSADFKVRWQGYVTIFR